MFYWWLICCMFVLYLRRIFLENLNYTEIMNSTNLHRWHQTSVVTMANFTYMINWSFLVCNGGSTNDIWDSLVMTYIGRVRTCVNLTIRVSFTAFASIATSDAISLHDAIITHPVKSMFVLQEPGLLYSREIWHL